MFTGIVEEIGLIKSFDGTKLVVECSKVLKNTLTGDSIAIDGCCQTVVSMTSNTFTANVSSETLKITKGFKSGEKVNLERALTPQTRMGGHIVQGHVDSIGKYRRIYSPSASSQPPRGPSGRRGRCFRRPAPDAFPHWPRPECR